LEIITLATAPLFYILLYSIDATGTPTSDWNKRVGAYPLDYSHNVSETESLGKEPLDGTSVHYANMKLTAVII
jgi:hypothetical protein